ncbi:MAG TPA: hypothetical protein VKT82_27065 [Ktedonobacterales bacterium]|nr:hypothetical protein [Ktedonobacterales bacterium]
MSNIQVPSPAAPAPGRPQPAPQQAARARPGSNSFFKNLGVPGLLWVIAGLLICGSFWLPWFTSTLVCNDAVCKPPITKDPHFVSHYAASPTGFSVANGTFVLTSTGPSGTTVHEGFSFLLLWLIFLAGVLLVVLPLLLALSRVHADRTRTFILVLGLLLLIVEVGYAISASQALPQTKSSLAVLLNSLALRSGRLAVFDFSTGPAVGFWLTLAATLGAIGASLYDRFSASLGQGFDMGLFWRNLGLAGQVMLLAGIALVVAFFLPWFSMPDPTAGTRGGYQIIGKQVTVIPQTLSGWSTAVNGLQTPFFAGGSCTSCVTPHVSIFLSLWLIALAALGLVAVAWMLGRALLWRRMAAILACTICLVALTLEAFFLLEVQSLQTYDEQVFQAAGQQLKGTAYGVTWGFWAALAITGVALLVSGFLLLQRHKSVTGRPIKP